MKRTRISSLLLVLFFIISTATAQKLQSPDKQLELSFSLDANSTPFYSLTYKGKQIIGQSKLGFVVRDGAESLDKGFTLLKTSNSASNTSWEPVWGEQKVITDNHTEMLVELESKGQLMNIRFRLFNDGLGFRYEFPKQEKIYCFVVQDELTEFNLTRDYKAFWIPGDFNANEYEYTTCNISEIPAFYKKAVHELFAQKPVEQPATNTPVMLKSADGIYVNIHEAALLDYPAMQLAVDASKYTFKAILASDAWGGKADINTPFHTPWRTVVVSDDARKILASKLILNLNEPCTYDDVSWIKPTKYIGVWWEMFIGRGTWNYTNDTHIKLGVTDYSKATPNGTHAANTANVKKYIDFAAKHGFDQVLVEGWNEGWEDWLNTKREYLYDFVTPYPDFNVKELQAYARSKGVRVMMHHETGGSASNYERHMDNAFRFMNENGYTAVKTGYVSYIRPKGEVHDGQWMINHYANVARTAAKYKIMINSHEAARPTGLCRTYPNWLAQESARGTEYEAMGGLPPEHTTILPFTRLMGGPMDYTPGIMQTVFSYYNPENKGQARTTLAKQLAYYVTIYSPLQMAADLPENYERFSDAFQFIKDVAIDWDETWILEAEPGDYVTTARKAKAKDEWFVGAITDENARIATIDLAFLPSGKKYEATIYEDGKNADWKTNPITYNIRKIKLNTKKPLKINLAPGGGCAIKINEIK